MLADEKQRQPDVSSSVAPAHRRRMVSVVAAIVAFVVIVAIGKYVLVPWLKPEPEETSPEVKELEGVWQTESMTLFGRPMKPDPSNQWEIRGSLMRHVNADSMRVIDLDTSKEPKRMILRDCEHKATRPVLKADGQMHNCIYSIEGDKLTIVSARGPKGEYSAEFPKSLNPGLDGPAQVTVMKRISK